MDAKLNTSQNSPKKEDNALEAQSNEVISQSSEVSSQEAPKTKRKYEKKIKYPTWDSRRAKDKRAKKKEINPAKPLSNAKHELVARHLAAGAKQKEAYKAVYTTSVVDRNPAITTHSNVIARYRYLLEQSPKTSTKAITQRLEALVDATKVLPTKDGVIEVADNPIRLDTIKTILKVQGVLDDRNVVTNVQTQPVSQVDADRLDDIIQRLDNMSRQLKVSSIPDVVDIT